MTKVNELYTKLIKWMRTCGNGSPRYWALDFNEQSTRTDNKKLNMYLGLVFWKFVRAEVQRQAWENRRTLLGRFVNHDNPYIAVVAMIESLPVPVFRRVLWRNNINYESCLSFLRRLSKKDYEAIRKNYNDLLVDGKQPRVLSFFESLQSKFKVEALMESEDDRFLRNQDKGSWSYNLLGLDFGFNAYCNGLNDDNKSEAKSWVDFLSLKNHSDDFIVNQEFGKYWWLYRTARSNWGWKRNKNVSLKRQICPGFWWTFFIHLIFWLISPVLAVTFGSVTTYINSGLDLFWAIPLGLVGCITPLWLVSATIWTTLRWLLPAKRREKIAESIIVFSEISRAFIGILVVVYAVFLAVYILYHLCIFLHPSYGIIGTLLIITLTMLYFGSHIKEEKWINFNERHVVFQIIYIAAAIRILFEFIIQYDYLIAKAFSFTLSFLQAMGFIGMFVVFFLIFPFMILLLEKFIKNKRALEQIMDALIVFMIALIIPGMVLVFYVAYHMMEALILLGVSGLAYFGIFVSFTFMWFSFFILMFFVYRKAFFSDPEMADYKNWTKTEGNGWNRFEDEKYDEKDAPCKPINHVLLKWYLRKNKSYKALAPEQRKTLLNKAHWLVYCNLGCHDTGKTLRKLLPVMTNELVEELKTLDFSSIEGDKSRFRVFDLLLQGIDFQLAQEIVAAEIEVKQEHNQRLDKILTFIIKPFVAIDTFFKMLGERIAQIKWLWEKFHEMCPFIKQDGQIEMESM